MHTVKPPSPGPYEHHHDWGGWISGSMLDQPAADRRPLYSPAVLVAEVQRVLGRAGISIDVDESMLPVARIAAGDLLRALGVQPVSVPHLHS